MKIAVVGATGLVGRKILKVLEEFNLDITELLPVASEKSLNKEISFMDKTYKVIRMQDAISQKPNIAIFSAGGDISLEWAPEFAKVGTTVIDNSSAWRMNPNNKLIIPEINANILTKEDKIIANPNCSTIQMIMAIAPLHKTYGIKRIVVSTYQSISGSGIKAVRQMENERKGIDGEKVYPYEIDKNCIPQCDSFTENRYTKEEMKLINETNKILNDNNIRVTATAVRVPVVGGHSESINLEFEKDFVLKDIFHILSNTKGISVKDDIDNCIYPMARFAHNKNDVFVGRIRRDFSCNNSLNLWVVSDNLRKGAATNAVQIAKYLIDNTLL